MYKKKDDFGCLFYGMFWFYVGDSKKVDISEISSNDHNHLSFLVRKQKYIIPLKIFSIFTENQVKNVNSDMNMNEFINQRKT